MRRRNSQATPRKRARQPAAQKAALSVVILAAGAGRRMQSALPVVGGGPPGPPLLKHVIDTARSLTPATLQVVYGHGGEQVRTALADEPVSWTLQPDARGPRADARQA